jgi:hypothetical protein
MTNSGQYFRQFEQLQQLFIDRCVYLDKDKGLFRTFA